MSNIGVNLYRSDDHRILRVKFIGDFIKPYEYALLSFKCEGQNLDVISTSNGIIDDENNAKITGKNVELYVEYPNSGNKLECLVGYYAQNNLLDHENLIASFEGDKQILPNTIVVSHLKTIPGSFESRLTDFLDALNRRTSQWKINISCPDDLVLDIATKGRDPIMVSFGEDSVNLAISDYIFRLDQQVSHMAIPREIIKRQYPKYQPHCKLGIFEIVKPDFLEVKAFYKTRISNLLTLSDMVIR